MKYENLEKAKVLCKEIETITTLLEDLNRQNLTITINMSGSYCILKIELGYQNDVNIDYGSNFIKGLINVYNIRLEKIYKELELL